MAKNYYVGVDIGGTGVEAALFEENGRMRASKEFATQEYVDSGILIELSKTVREMVKDEGLDWSEVASVGIGAPGIIDPDRGIVFNAPNLKWKDYELKKEAEDLFHKPIYVDNDVNTGLLGEVYFGAAKGKRNVLLIMVGTSIGAGLLINGEIYRGASWASGEIGHMVSDPEAASGFSPVKDGYGFLSSKMGGVAIAHHYCEEKRREGNCTESELSELKTADVFRLAKKGDTVALRIIEEGVLHTGMAIVNAAALLNPEMIVLGGGVSQSGDWFIEKIEHMLAEHVPSPTEVVLAGLKDQSPIYGALALCLLMEKEGKVQAGKV